MCVCSGTCLPWHTHRSQKTIFWSQFYFAVSSGNLGIELRSSGLCGKHFHLPCHLKPSHKAETLNFFIEVISVCIICQNHYITGGHTKFLMHIYSSEKLALVMFIQLTELPHRNAFEDNLFVIGCELEEHFQNVFHFGWESEQLWPNYLEPGSGHGLWNGKMELENDSGTKKGNKPVSEFIWAILGWRWWEVQRNPFWFLLLNWHCSER